MNLTLRFVSRRMVLTLCLLLAVILSVTNFPLRAQAQAAQPGRIRFIHAVPDAPAVDILVDKVLAARGLPFATATRYLTVDKGDHTVTITTSGASTPLYEGKVTIAAGLAKTVIAEGTASAVELGLFDDELGPIGAGKTRVTAANAVKGSPSIDVLEVAGGTAPVLPLIQGLAYGQPYGTVDIPAISSEIAIVSAGNDPDKAITKLDKVSLLAGTFNMVIFLGKLTSDQASAIVVTAAVQPDDPTNSGLLRIVHAVPDAPAVDVYIGDVLIAPGLNFGDATPHISLAVGSLAIAVRTAGDLPSKDPLVTATLNLVAGQAATLVISGTAAQPVMASTDDNIGKLDPKIARIHVINATGDGTASLALTNGPSVVAVNPTSNKDAEVGAGVYDATASVDNPALQIASNLQLSGGVLYDVIVSGSATTSKLIVAATSLSEQPGSAPAGAAQAVAQNTTPAGTLAATTAATMAATSAVVGATVNATVAAAPSATLAAPVATTAATVAATVAATTANPPAGTASASGPVDVAGTAASLKLTKAVSVGSATATAPAPKSGKPTPTATGAEAPTQAPAPVSTAGPSILGVVSTNPGVNLKIREYPNVTARTLALVPSQTTLTISGVRGPAAAKANVTSTATLVPTVTTTPQEIDLATIWLFVTWDQSDGGTVSGWVSAQYLAITKDGKTIFQPSTILAFKPIPEDTFGSIGSSAVTPVSVDVNQIIGTIVVNEGVRVQLRRTPTVSGESMTLLDNGAQVVVLFQTQTKLTGAVGEPSSPTWFFARYQTTTGAVTGWVNAQYLKLSRKGRTADVTDVPVAPANNLPRGDVAGAGVSAPVQSQGVAGPGISALVDKLNPGVSLQLRNNPDANALSLDKIALNTQLNVLGRNADGTWLKVDYNGEQGWVAIAYVTVTKNGKPMNIADLPNLSSGPSTAGSATPTLAATPTSVG